VFLPYPNAFFLISPALSPALLEKGSLLILMLEMDEAMQSLAAYPLADCHPGRPVAQSDGRKDAGYDDGHYPPLPSLTTIPGRLAARSDGRQAPIISW
jgi:hypothetical protein